MASNYKFIIFLVLNSPFFFFFNLSDAASELVKSVCKRSNDEQYCLKAFGSDPRSDSLGLHALGMLSVQMNILQSLDTLDKFPELLKNTTDEVGRRRLGTCQTDFETALSKFREAFFSADKKTYSDAKNLVADGTNAAFDCRTVYKWGEPVSESPVSDDIQKINSNTASVINTVLDMLMGK